MMTTENRSTSRVARTGVLAGVLGVSVAVVLSGCVGSGGAASPQSSVALPQKNIAKWTMPLDDYIPSTLEDHAGDYAEDLLMKPCMAEHGVAWPVPWQDMHASEGASFNDAGMDLFTVALAKKYGYHPAPGHDPSAAAWQKLAQRKLSDSDFAVMVKCRKQVRKHELPLLPSNTENYASSLGGEADHAASLDPKVIAAGKRWKSCMSPAGISNLPDEPYANMPTASMYSRFHSYGPAPSPEEIKDATLDAKCRVSSGYKRTLYDDVWARQAAMVRKHADKLKRVAAALAKHQKEVDAVIAAHAPQAPAQ